MEHLSASNPNERARSKGSFNSNQSNATQGNREQNESTAALKLSPLPQVSAAFDDGRSDTEINGLAGKNNQQYNSRSELTNQQQ